MDISLTNHLFLTILPTSINFFINIFEQTILTMTIAIIVLEVLGLYLLLDF